MKRLALFLIFFFSFSLVFSQEGKDTVIKLSTLNTMPNNTVNDDNIQIEKKHSPGKAALFSTFVPGLGQIYNKQIWKTPIIYAGLGTLVYFAISNCRNMNKFKDEYYNRINGSGTLLQDYTTYSDESIYSLYNAYKDNFHLMVILGVALYAAQILDAYVYGYLFSYDISEDISLNVAPSFLPSISAGKLTNTLGLSFNIKF